MQNSIRESISSIDTLLQSLLHGEQTSITISYNSHRDRYETVRDNLEPHRLYYGGYWKNRESIEEAIRTDCAWSIFVYPDTPVGSYEMLAPTLSECIELALANDSSSLGDSCFSLKSLDDGD